MFHIILLFFLNEQFVFRRIYLGGKSFIIDEEGNEIPDSEEVTTTLSSTAAKVSQAAAAVSAVPTTNGDAADDAKNGTSETRYTTFI